MIFVSNVSPVVYLSLNNMASSEDGSSPKAKRIKLSSESMIEADNASSDNPSYAKNYLRVSKPNLYMILALCIEDFDEDFDESLEHYRKVGAVLVLPNDVVCAADCSRDGVHAVQRLLMKHYDKAEGCKMFVSRKPCAMCAKLLVQAKVQRVLFLPFEPEYYRSPKPLEPNANKETHEEIDRINNEINESNKTQMKQVDNLFTASSIAQTRFVLQVEKPVLVDAERKTPSQEHIRQQIDEEKKKLIDKYGFGKNPEWMESIKDNLPWPAFDNEIKAEVLTYFENAMEWMARAMVLQGRGLKYEFVACSEKSKNSIFNPVNHPTHAKQARRFMAIARFLAERTDDPKTGVGAVIVQFPEMEIISLGWNGFPLKALYGEFPRASNSDESTVDKKSPYVIHAEQNALLFRNRKKIDDDAILFVTRSPCNECALLTAMHKGITTVVVDDDVFLRGKKLGYEKFLDMVENGKFVCFQTRETRELKTGPSNVSKNLQFND